MNSFKKMSFMTGIAPTVAAGFLFLFIYEAQWGTPARFPVVSAPPGAMVVAMGDSYDPASNKIASTVFQIPVSVGERQPRWDPATQDLPVPLDQLEKIAFKNALGADETTWVSWKVTNVEFKRLGFSGMEEEKAREDRWSCVLTLTNQDPAHYDFKTVCLLLDGTYVPAQPQ
jgi:hypothetical protein